VLFIFTDLTATSIKSCFHTAARHLVWNAGGGSDSRLSRESLDIRISGKEQVTVQ
jgi:hypothetical protein